MALAAAASRCGKTLIVARLRRAPVDDAGVIELVGNDNVVATENRRHRSRVCRESALEDDGSLGVLERRKPPLELHVDVHGAGDGADRARPHAISPDRLDRLLAQCRMRGQTEIVVRGEVDDGTVIDGGTRRLLSVENSEGGGKDPVRAASSVRPQGIAEGPGAYRASISTSKESLSREGWRPPRRTRPVAPRRCEISRKCRQTPSVPARVLAATRAVP
jgi:hypothetical protein